MNHILYPWQQQSWQRLYQAVHNDNLAHALLLHAPLQTGAEAFARFVAASLLCTQLTKQGSCGQCTECVLFQAGNHPDYMQLSPEGDVIKIDQIRALVASLHTSRHSQGYRVIIIEQAETMNMAAANSLLKTLEEPPEKTLIILLAAEPGRLLATVRSRCQQLSLRPTKEHVIAWLQQQQPQLTLAEVKARYYLLGHVPLQLNNNEYIDDYLQRIAQWLAVLEGQNVRYGVKPTRLAEQLADWSRLCHWLLQAKLGVRLPLDEVLVQRLLKAVNKIQPRALANFYQELQQSIKQLNQHNSLNETLLLDGHWVSWRRLVL